MHLLMAPRLAPYVAAVADVAYDMIQQGCKIAANLHTE